MGDLTNIQQAASDRLAEGHSDLCRSHGLFGAGCDCGASQRAIDNIVQETSDAFADFLRSLSRQDHED